MKKLVCSMMLCVSVFAVAQNTSSKIPSDASIVATIKGSNLLQLMSIEEMNSSFIGNEILKELSRPGRENNSIEDFGFDLNNSAHYFLQTNDSITYNAFIMPLKDVNKFESFINDEGRNEFINENGLRTFKDKNEGVVWSDSVFIVVEGTVNDMYFQDETVMQRHGLQSENDGYEQSEVGYATEVVESAGDAYEVEETVVESTEIMEGEAEETIVDDTEEVYEEVEIEETVIESTEDYEEDYNDNNSTYNYYDAYSDNYTIKRALSKSWSLLKAKQIATQTADRSILKNKSYLKSLDDKAEATLWINDFGQLYTNLFSRMYFNELGGFDLGAMYANNGLNAKLFLENDKMMLSSTYIMSDDMAKSYKKMTSRKLNKKFLNYVNEDRMIGYMSSAMDTKGMLDEYPKLMKSIYKNMPYYGEEAVLALDLFSLLLDEEAVSEVLQGDMLFLLSGISKQEVSYTSYEYNDDYEYVEIEKTKTETLPDFLLMASTEDPSLLNKVISYTTKKEMVTFDNGFYTFKAPRSPFSIHFMIKDNIVFLGTSKVEMRKIATGTFDAKVSSDHKKRMLSNNYSLFVSAEQLAAQLPIEEMGLDRSGKLEWFLNTSEDAYVTASKIKGNTVNTEMVIGVPATEDNALKYIFNIIEKLAK